MAPNSHSFPTWTMLQVIINYFKFAPVFVTSDKYTLLLDSGSALKVECFSLCSYVVILVISHSNTSCTYQLCWHIVSSFFIKVSKFQYCFSFYFMFGYILFEYYIIAYMDTGPYSPINNNRGLFSLFFQ